MDTVWPIAYALLLWWFSTGTIFYLDSLPRRTFKWSMAGGTRTGFLMLGALTGLGLVGHWLLPVERLFTWSLSRRNSVDSAPQGKQQRVIGAHPPLTVTH